MPVLTSSISSKRQVIGYHMVVAALPASWQTLSQYDSDEAGETVRGITGVISASALSGKKSFKNLSA